MRAPALAAPWVRSERGAEASSAAHSDDGSILLLLLGLVVLSALLITVVVDVSAAFVARRDLLAAADGAALAGAQAVDEPAVYRNGVHGALPLDPELVRKDVDGYLHDVAASSSLHDLGWQVVTDGTQVRVLVSGRLRLPVVNAVVAAVTSGDDGVLVTASATARSAVVD
jgi:hypothetical protein